MDDKCSYHQQFTENECSGGNDNSLVGGVYNEREEELDWVEGSRQKGKYWKRMSSF